MSGMINTQRFRRLKNGENLAQIRTLCVRFALRESPVQCPSQYLLFIFARSSYYNLSDIFLKTIDKFEKYDIQSVEKRPSRESEGGRFSVFEAKKREKGKEVGGMVISPLSFCKFFEIHGSKFKPYPI